MSYLQDLNISLCFFTETWLTDNNNNITASIKSYGYNIIHTYRSDAHNKTKGGGVAIVYQNTLNLTQVFMNHGKTFESVMAKFRDTSGNNVCCICTYRPGILSDLFYDEFDEFIGTVFIRFSKIIICGDLNLHLDNVRDQNTVRFAELLSSYGLQQLVKEPTHSKGHLLDVVISSNKVIKTDSVFVNAGDSLLFPSCDHHMVSFTLNNFSIIGNQKKRIAFRNLRTINREQLHMDLSSSLSTINSNDTDFEAIIDSYNTSCLHILDKHAPLRTKEINDREDSPWFDGEYKCLRAQRRKAERKGDHKLYVSLRDQCNDLANKKKHDFIKTQFEKHNNSPKSLYKFVDTFLDKDNSLPLPPTDDLKQCVDDFNNFFQMKIDGIRSKIGNHTEDPSSYNKFNGSKLETFSPTTVDEISEILKDTEFKSSSVDPLPSCLIKENMDIFLPALCEIVNASLNSGSIAGLKLAHITPLLKGTGLDTTNLKNFRPISNLTFEGKLIERVVLRRLSEHLDHNNLNIPYQSGYKKSHSTETLLIRIVNDLLIASSENKATVVMMLDLSAAFDTVDHSKLLIILKHDLGISENPCGKSAWPNDGHEGDRLRRHQRRWYWCG